jgi:hypothetical protein
MQFSGGIRIFPRSKQQPRQIERIVWLIGAVFPLLNQHDPHARMRTIDFSQRARGESHTIETIPVRSSQRPAV